VFTRMERILPAGAKRGSTKERGIQKRAQAEKGAATGEDWAASGVSPYGTAVGSDSAKESEEKLGELAIGPVPYRKREMHVREGEFEN